MRRLTASRAWAAVAVVATIVAVLAVMFPGLGFGQTIFSHHGGTPSDVFMSTVPHGTCAFADREGVTAMPTAINFDQGSHLLVSFASQWSGLNADQELLLGFQIVGVDEVFYSPLWRNGSVGVMHQSGTVMWTFEDVPAGDYTVQMFAQVRAEEGQVPAHAAGTHAVLEQCALTVFVSPVAAPPPPIP